MNGDELPQMAAAGGLVLSGLWETGRYALLIRKHRLWDLPKGKRRPGERPEHCALREIAEETGLNPQLLSIRAPLCRSSYISHYSYGPVNKTVDWFLLDYAGAPDDALQPQVAEDIDLCQWVPAAALLETMQGARAYLSPVRQAIELALAQPAARR